MSMKNLLSKVKMPGSKSKQKHTNRNSDSESGANSKDDTSSPEVEQVSSETTKSSNEEQNKVSIVADSQSLKPKEPPKTEDLLSQKNISEDQISSQTFSNPGTNETPPTQNGSSASDLEKSKIQVSDSKSKQNIPDPMKSTSLSETSCTTDSIAAKVETAPSESNKSNVEEQSRARELDSLKPEDNLTEDSKPRINNTNLDNNEEEKYEKKTEER